MTLQQPGQGLVPQPLAAGHLQRGELEAGREEAGPDRLGDVGVSGELEVCEGGEGRGGGEPGLLTGDAGPADGEADQAGAEGPDQGEGDLPAVTAVAEEAELPELGSPHLQHRRDVLQADSSNHQGLEPSETLEVAEAVELPRVDVVDDEMVEVREDDRDELSDAGSSL